ncbi:MAG: glycosyltransferase family 2 protein [Lachnospiraceae bacterium]|nr:glycosyltransferase family 2 protein [Lachnospiraceae bacterium]
MKTVVLLTCHNRIKKTERCLRSLDDAGLDISYVAVDDGSTDGTGEMLRGFGREKGREMTVIKGNGDLYWAGGMRLAMRRALDRDIKYDYVLLINDDVLFYEGALRRMIEYAGKRGRCCVTGAMNDRDGKGTYGGVRYDRTRVRAYRVGITDSELVCDAANMNAFLIPYPLFNELGAFDSHYRHRMADFDYSFEIGRHGCPIYLTDFYVGRCRLNVPKMRWENNSLPGRIRLRLKESPKGLPAGEWFYYLKKNFGIRQALWNSVTPYIRIAFGK